MYSSMRRMFRRLTWFAFEKSSGEPPQSRMSSASTKTKSKRVLRPRRYSRAVLRSGWPCFRSSRENRGVDRVEDDDRRRPLLVHECERPLEVDVAPGHDPPRPRRVRPDVLHESFDRVLESERVVVLGQIPQRARLDRAVRQEDGLPLWPAAAPGAALEDSHRRACGVRVDVRTDVVEPEAVPTGEVRLRSRVRGKERIHALGCDADVHEPDVAALSERELPRDMVGHDPRVGRGPARDRRVEAGAACQLLQVCRLRLAPARASEDEDAGRLFQAVDQRELGRPVVLDGRW